MHQRDERVADDRAHESLYPDPRVVVDLVVAAVVAVLSVLDVAVGLRRGDAG